MIQTFDINRLFPRFILKDVNGLAMAKAIEAGLNYFLQQAKEGLDTLQNVDEMPEWRLDELAWEYNCLYDYSADVDVKRGWIRDAVKNYQLHGTAEGVRQYLKTYFGESSVDEFWEFGGDPGEFNVTVTGLRSDENEAWIRKAVEKAKNVRSVLNNIVFNGGESACEIETATFDVGIAVVIDSVMYD